MMPLIKARKQPFKKIGLLAALILMFSLSFLSLTSASTTQSLGNLSSGPWGDMSNGGTGTGLFSGTGPVNTTINEGYWELNYGSFFMSGGAPYKFLVYDSNGTLLFVSPIKTPPTARLTSGAWDNVYFPGGLTVRDNQSLIFGVTTAWTNIMYLWYSGNYFGQRYNYTIVDLYGNPRDTTFGWVQDNYLFYLTMTSIAYPGNMGGNASGINEFGINGGTIVYPSATPTPTAGPTASPTPDVISTILTTTITTNNIMLAIAVGFIMGCALLGAKFAGAWGFLAGLTVGTGLDYFFGLAPLWFVVLIGIVDAVALIRGMSRGSSKGEAVD